MRTELGLLKLWRARESVVHDGPRRLWWNVGEWTPASLRGFLFARGLR
jgi:hypothetical protein